MLSIRQTTSETGATQAYKWEVLNCAIECKLARQLGNYIQLLFTNRSQLKRPLFCCSVPPLGARRLRAKDSEMLAMPTCTSFCAALDAAQGLDGVLCA